MTCYTGKLRPVECFRSYVPVLAGLALIAIPYAVCQQAPAPAVAAGPVHLTAAEDHKRLMDLLGIKELRPGEEKDANWDEAKANVYPNLPDPLVEKNGKNR